VPRLCLLLPFPLETLTRLVRGLDRLSSTLTNSILAGGGDGARISLGGVAGRMMGVEERGACTYCAGLSLIIVSDIRVEERSGT
jgi:hypothetical protein